MWKLMFSVFLFLKITLYEQIIICTEKCNGDYVPFNLCTFDSFCIIQRGNTDFLIGSFYFLKSILNVFFI